MSAPSKDELLLCFHDKQRVTMRRLLFLYGDDINLILNALHEMAARLAIAMDVDAVGFSNGVKHHWDSVAEGVSISVADRKMDS